MRVCITPPIQTDMIIQISYLTCTLIFIGFKGFFKLERCHYTVLKKHTASACHREAVEVVITLPAITRDIGEQLSTTHQ